jgi:hypothetical protein
MALQRGAFFSLLALGAALGFAGCSSGSGITVPTIPEYGIPSAGGALSIPAAGGVSASVYMPAVTAGAGASIIFTSQTSAPSSAPGLQSIDRHLKSANTPVYYFSFVVTQDVTWNGSPSFSVNLPQAPTAGAAYYIASYAVSSPGNGWNMTAFGPATVSGNTLKFAAPSGSFSLPANQLFWYAVYASS